MTFGNGANGCLGHGNLLDVKEVHKVHKPVNLHHYYAMNFVYQLGTIMIVKNFYFLQPKIVETLIGKQVIKISCGAMHVMAVTGIFV